MFDAEKIYFPINAGGNHWVCVVANMKERKITFCDSLGGNRKHFVMNIMNYIRDEHLDKTGEPLPYEEFWTVDTHTTKDSPRQENGCDCGVFVCMFMDFDSLGFPLEFHQAHAPQFRRVMALSIGRGKLVHNDWS